MIEVVLMSQREIALDVNKDINTRDKTIFQAIILH